ncbi:MAG TPA: plastocyanin/azurin family copper-binding protein [Thermoanaerobaculia bacterium]|nr:plastocyanin/azurin family copper-binding protein [Thermoanaerobaculia bacterium]
MSPKPALWLLTMSVLLASCGGGGGGGSTPTQPGPTTTPQTVVIQVMDGSFSPKHVTINPGDTVRWVMAGTTYTHTATAVDGSFDSGAVFTAPGATYQRTFDATTAGKTFEYFCKVHYSCCGMAGAIQVGSAAPPPKPGY